MTPETVRTVDSIVVSSTRTLFANYGVAFAEDVDGAAETPSDHDICASIGFAAPVLHGALLLTAQKALVARAWPGDLRHREPSDRDVCDWAGELVNQLLGLVKLALLGRRVGLDQGTPVVVEGWHLHRVRATTALARRYLFRTDGASLLVYVDADAADGFALAEPKVSAGEGEDLFF